MVQRSAFARAPVRLRLRRQLRRRSGIGVVMAWRATLYHKLSAREQKGKQFTRPRFGFTATAGTRPLGRTWTEGRRHLRFPGGNRRCTNLGELTQERFSYIP